MKAILVGLDHGDGKLEDTFPELEQLARTLGVDEVETAVFKLRKLTAKTLIGPGQAEKLYLFCEEMGPVDLVIFNDDLKPLQYNSLTEILGLEILDRTQLILEIFARHATTGDGKLQIEHAQLKYALPRLKGKGGTLLSRLGGGIGTRGPGETALEVERRAIRTRIATLDRELAGLRKHRDRLRDARKETPLPIVAVVGYTNAGKSTLLNALSGADILVEDKLFSTLDPTTRMVTLSSRQRVLMSDTVGFIQKLPTHLVHAFRSTLEEAVYADLLLHVVDVADERWKSQFETVEKLLEELKCGKLPRIIVLNKCDRIAAPPRLDVGHAQIAISARAGTGLEELLALIEKSLTGFRKDYRLRIPRTASDVFKVVYAHGEISEIEEEPDHVRLTVLLDRRFEGKVRDYIV